MVNEDPYEEELTAKDLANITSIKGLKLLLKDKKIDYSKALTIMKYEEELVKLQIELVRWQLSILENNQRVAILFEGRDAAGKGGTIRRFIQHLNPRSFRLVALTKPTEVEQGQWYFQRYSTHLPNQGEIVFFDRSWYNRAVVEPVMGFCSPDQYDVFINQVKDFEQMLIDDGIQLIKLWFNISKEEQKKRFKERETDPLKQWKLSPIDKVAQERWDAFTHYKMEMFKHSHTKKNPWIVVEANNKKIARLESIRYVLSQATYPNKGGSGAFLEVDPDVVRLYPDAYKD
ncbi:polyphosphate kinase 2 [bacterium SCSIO 12741]|nr:polyphosphate kinase 2 [bacterium SCSIO 12741]